MNPILRTILLMVVHCAIIYGICRWYGAWRDRHPENNWRVGVTFTLVMTFLIAETLFFCWVI